jgi:hypothetical protein
MLKPRFLVGIQVLRTSKPEVLASGERTFTLRMKGTVLEASNLIDGIPDMLGDMESIKDDLL